MQHKMTNTAEGCGEKAPNRQHKARDRQHMARGDMGLNWAHHVYLANEGNLGNLEVVIMT